MWQGGKAFDFKEKVLLTRIGASFFLLDFCLETRMQMVVSGNLIENDSC